MVPAPSCHFRCRWARHFGSFFVSLVLSQKVAGRRNRIAGCSSCCSAPSAPFSRLVCSIYLAAGLMNLGAGDRPASPTTAAAVAAVAVLQAQPVLQHKAEKLAQPWANASSGSNVLVPSAAQQPGQLNGGNQQRGLWQVQATGSAGSPAHGPPPGWTTLPGLAPQPLPASLDVAIQRHEIQLERLRQLQLEVGAGRWVGRSVLAQGGTSVPGGGVGRQGAVGVCNHAPLCLTAHCRWRPGRRCCSSCSRRSCLLAASAPSRPRGPASRGLQQQRQQAARRHRRRPRSRPRGRLRSSRSCSSGRICCTARAPAPRCLPTAQQRQRCQRQAWVRTQGPRRKGQPCQVLWAASLPLLRRTPPRAMRSRWRPRHR